MTRTNCIGVACRKETSKNPKHGNQPEARRRTRGISASSKFTSKRATCYSPSTHTQLSVFQLDTRTVRPSSTGPALPVICSQTGSHRATWAPQPSGCQVGDDISTPQFCVYVTFFSPSSGFLSLFIYLSVPHLCIWFICAIMPIADLPIWDCLK